MKITLREIKPNPYRDLANYPIHREKIESLKASIRSTGFWDNVLLRKSDDGKHYELAYGHHRFEALRELVNEKLLEEDFAFEAPVRKLDDAAMIQIMANENMDEYKVTAEIIDDTVRVAREFISGQTKTALSDITASDISQFLSGNWSEDKVTVSLQRLGLFDRGTLKREQLKGLSHTAARTIQREVAKVEKAMLRDRMDRLHDDEETSEQDHKRIRSQVQKVANHVAEVLSEHVKAGGTLGEAKEKSIDAQADMIPEDAPPDQRVLSTIDAAAKAVSARDFERKVEMLLKYKEYMSTEAKDELRERLFNTAKWCKAMLEELGD